MKPDLALELRSDPMLLGASRAMLRSYLDRLGFTSEKSAEIVLAVDEGITNAIRHGYEGRTNEVVSLRVGSDSEWVQIEIMDGGICAPVDRIARKAMEPPNADTLTPGGLGVQLMYEVCDEVKFERCADHGNHVRMRIRRPRESGGADSAGRKDT